MRPSIRSLSSFAALFAAVPLLCACPVKSECLGGTVDVTDECVCPPGTIETPPGGGSDICTAVDAGVVDAGDAGPRDAGDAAVADGGQDAGPCGMPCVGTTPVCDAADGMCVECTATELAACTAALPACVGRECVECETSADCTDTAATPVCNLADNTCVACNGDSDCMTLGAPQCDTAAHACVPCTGSAACAGHPGTTVCGGGTCVECTAADRAACGTRVCNGATRACVAELAGSANVCQTCVADDQCQIGQLCVPMTFGAASTAVGSYCLWRQDAPAGPAGDCTVASNRPYVNAVSLASIDDTTALVCSLAVTTCAAVNAYRMATCTAPAMPNLPTDPSNLGCGVPTLQDAWCRPFGGGSRCTLPCLSDDDCKSGSTCLATVPQVCSL